MKKPKVEMRRYNVEFLGKVFVRGVVTVTAIDHQGAERAARKAIDDDLIQWKPTEYDDEYAPKIKEVVKL